MTTPYAIHAYQTTAESEPKARVANVNPMTPVYYLIARFMQLVRVEL